MTRLILVRHGLTDWNKQGRIQGQLDIPLSAEGKQQVKAIISNLAHLKGIKRISAIYSSCLSRSWETAEAIGEVFGIKVKRMKELNELDQGIWQGLLETQIIKSYRKLYNIWKANPLLTAPPKGEDIKAAQKRIISAIQKIVGWHSGQTVCIVAHEIASAIIKCHYTAADMNRIWEHAPKSASLEVIELKNG